VCVGARGKVGIYQLQHAHLLNCDLSFITIKAIIIRRWSSILASLCSHAHFTYVQCIWIEHLINYIHFVYRIDNKVNYWCWLLLSWQRGDDSCCIVHHTHLAHLTDLRDSSFWSHLTNWRTLQHYCLDYCAIMAVGLSLWTYANNGIISCSLKSTHFGITDQLRVNDQCPSVHTHCFINATDLWHAAIVDSSHASMIKDEPRHSTNKYRV